MWVGKWMFASGVTCHQIYLHERHCLASVSPHNSSSFFVGMDAGCLHSHFSTAAFSHGKRTCLQFDYLKYSTQQGLSSLDSLKVLLYRMVHSYTLLIRQSPPVSCNLNYKHVLAYDIMRILIEVSCFYILFCRELAIDSVN